MSERKGMNVFKLSSHHLLIVPFYCRLKLPENDLIIHNIAIFLQASFIAEAKSRGCTLSPSHLDKIDQVRKER
jgi:hypothetical protein